MHKVRPSVEVSLQIGAGHTFRILEANDLRTAVTISCSRNNMVVSSLRQLSLNNPPSGLLIQATSLPFVFCRCHHGDWVTRELWGLSTGGTVNFTIIEAFEEDA